MSKSAKIDLAKPVLEQVIKPIIAANAGAYGGKTNPNASITAALGQAVAAKAAKRNAGGGLQAGVSADDWIDMGRQLFHDLKGRQPESVNAVCDTCSGLVLYILRDRLPAFHGTVELVADQKIHHHFVVVDRAGNLSDHTQWGGDCFVIDLWQAKFAGNEVTPRGCFEVAHHYKHGIYRNPSEHPYARDDGPHLQVDQTYAM